MISIRTHDPTIFQRFVEQCDMVTLLQQQVLDEKDQLQKMKNEVERATKGREDRAKDSEDTSSPKNVSPNPEGMIVCGNFLSSARIIPFIFHARSL